MIRRCARCQRKYDYNVKAGKPWAFCNECLRHNAQAELNALAQARGGAK